VDTRCRSDLKDPRIWNEVLKKRVFSSFGGKNYLGEIVVGTLWAKGLRTDFPKRVGEELMAVANP
jgi:hypothetical protein